jgi:hypothetical protein
MQINFTPKELEGAWLPREGEFLVRLGKQKETRSKNNDPMIEIEMIGLASVQGKKGVVRLIPGKTTSKLKSLFWAAGYSNEQMMSGVDTKELCNVVIHVRRHITGQTNSNGKTYEDYTEFFRKPTEVEMKSVVQPDDFDPNFDTDISL